MSRKAKGKRPVYFNDPECDKLLAIVMAVAGELAAVRERLDTLERIPAPEDCCRSWISSSSLLVCRFPQPGGFEP